MERIVTKCFLLAILCISLVAVQPAKSQVINIDNSIGGLSYCNVLLTDTANKFFSQELKMHIDVIDHGDTVNGAQFIYSFYTTQGIPVNSGYVVICCATYVEWNANNTEWAYGYVSGELALRKIFITFE